MAQIRHSITIAAPVERIQPLFTTARGFAQWWAEDVTENPNGTVTLGFFNRATTYRLAPIRMKASLGEWLCETGKEWSGTRLIFDLTPRANGALLLFTHADWKAETDYFVSCTTVWGELMFRLKAAAEGKAPGPLFKVAEVAY